MKKRTFFVFIISVILVFVNLNGFSWATVFNVNNITDLQNALITAQGNKEDDTINISAGTYPVTTTLTYKPSENYALTIVGEGSGSTILDGEGSVQILNIDTTGLVDDSRADITIRRVTFQNGVTYILDVYGGGLYVGTNSADIMVEHSAFYNNYLFNFPGIGGGALTSTNTGKITLTNNTFTNNHACFGGGAFTSTHSGIVTIEDNTFTSNGGWDGTGGGVDASSYSGTISLNNNYFIDNYSDFGGGSSTITYIGKIISTNNIFNGNIGWYGGGGAAGLAGMDDEEGGTMTFTNNTITGNETDSDRGDGLMVYLIGNNTTLNIYNNIIWGNISLGGDANDIYIDDDWDISISDNVGANVNLFNNDYSVNTVRYDNCFNLNFSIIT